MRQYKLKQHQLNKLLENIAKNENQSSIHDKVRENELILIMPIHRLEEHPRNIGLAKSDSQQIRLLSFCFILLASRFDVRRIYSPHKP